MTVFVCAACGTPITGVLTELAEVPGRPEFDGRVQADGYRRAPSTLALGFFALESEPWGAPFVPTDECRAAFPGGPCIGDPYGDGFLVSAGPRNTVVLHPDDAPHLQRSPDAKHVGCCGCHGQEGKNRTCPCGAEVGTVISECYTAYELHLDPGQIRAVAG
ncbi:hypothetical protein [Kitasatospora sp. McL0602]|uniref:hypothetical protein n=1 Tax=Kitasatospora sp. McL0602 TaxID=3439530 RepID=UPI003F89A35E